MATWEGVHMDAIRKLVNEYINARGITLEALAGMIGISRVSLWKKLSGRSPFLVNEAFALADVVGFDVNLFRC